MKTIHVAAAAIIDPRTHTLFATARDYGEWKGWWELPGGKLEPGETPEQALVREIWEELETEITIGDHVGTVEYDYPAFHLTMDCFTATVNAGKPILKEAEAACWLRPEELNTVKWLPADLELLPTLKECLKRSEENSSHGL